MKPKICDETNIFHLKCEIITYLDKKSNILKSVEVMLHEFERSHGKYESHSMMPLYIPIEMHYLELRDKSVLLEEWLCREPVLLQKIFQQVLYVAVSLKIPSIQAGQLHCPLKVRGYYSELSNGGAMLNIVAQYGGIASKCNYINQTAWYCYEECNENILVIPCNPMRAPFCDNCNKPMVEKQMGRDLGTKALVKFIKYNENKNKNIPHVTFEKMIWLCDDMLNELVLGQYYSVTYIQQNKKCIAWNLEKVPPMTSLMKELAIQKKWMSSEYYCPWTSAFVACYSITSHICQPSYQYLKLGLLLSIASRQECEDSPPLSVIVLGHNTEEIYDIMKMASNFVHRKGHSNVIQSSDGEVVSGPLSLARNGVCILGNWAQHIKTNRASAILSAISSGIVKAENGDTAPLRCCVWTYWNPVDTSKKKTKEIILTLNSLFGVIFPGDDDENIEAITDHLLLSATGGRHNCEVTSDMFAPNEDEIKELFGEIINWKVIIEPSAESLLREYFLAIRKDKPDQVPLRVLSVLEKITKANARLSLRCHAIKEDVLMAAFVYQKSLLTLYEDAGLQNYEFQNIQTLKDINDNMVEFGKWLRIYIDTFLH